MRGGAGRVRARRGLRGALGTWGLVATGAWLGLSASPLEGQVPAQDSATGFAQAPSSLQGILPLSPPRPTADARVRLRVDSAAMLIGSPNRLVITGPAGMSAVDFSALDTIKALQRLGEVTDSLKGDERQIALPFSVYDSVGLLIPNLPVVVGDERVFTNDVALVVSFAAVDTSIVRLRGIYAEPSRLSDYASWFAVGLGLLVLGLVAWWLWRARHPTQVLAAAAPPPLPPHEIALRRLAELRGSSLADAPWYAALDHVLRSYLEARYGIPALERTSREVAELLTQERLPAEDLSTLLERVDLIKFAKAAAGPAQRAEHLDQVERFVRATVPPVVTLADPSSPTDRPT